MYNKLSKFGKIKMNGAWCDFHESNVITGTISDDYCRIRIEEFKPKMNMGINKTLIISKVLSMMPGFVA